METIDETKMNYLMITEQVMQEQMRMNNSDSNIIHLEYVNITQGELDLESKDAFMHENNPKMEKKLSVYIFYLLVSIVAVITSLGFVYCIKN